MTDFKQVIAVRADLHMGRGKIAAQVGHACVMSAHNARLSYPEWFEIWWPSQAKIVVKVKGMIQINKIRQQAIHSNIPWALVSDAGHTQLEPGTVTCICLGPAPSQRIDDITGNLKLL